MLNRALYTNRNYFEIRHVLEHMPWKKYIDTNLMIAHGYLLKKKPSIEMFLVMMHRANLDNPSEVLMVGDEEYDKQMALNAKCDFIHINDLLLLATSTNESNKLNNICALIE